MSGLGNQILHKQKKYDSLDSQLVQILGVTKIPAIHNLTGNVAFQPHPSPHKIEVGPKECVGFGDQNPGLANGMP